MKYANILAVYFDSALLFLNFLVHACVLPRVDKYQGRTSAEALQRYSSTRHLKSATRATMSRSGRQMPRSSETMSKMMP